MRQNVEAQWAPWTAGGFRRGSCIRSAAGISQILLNLLSNAHDAVEKGTAPWVRISVHGDDDEVRIAVSEVVVLPLLVIVVPATRAVPSLYRWRVRSRIYRWYGALMAIERDMMLAKTDDDRRAIAGRLDDIEHAVNDLKTPLSFADQLYVLRDHVAMVRRRLDHGQPATAAT